MYCCPDTECIETSNASWMVENYWLVHHSNSIAKVINKLVSDRANAIVIIPYMTLSPFWPMLHNGRRI